MVSDIELDSRAVGRPMTVRVITPPNYAPDAAEAYPVLYFLHPWGLDPRYITDKLHIHQHLWRGMADGTLPPMVIALPTGEKSFYMNAADPPGHDWTALIERNEAFFRDALNQYGQYGDYLWQEVIPYIETHYRVRVDRAGRAMGGISMGGAGAAVHAFHNPAAFCAVGMHSPALFFGPPGRVGPPWIFGLDRESFAAHNPADAAQHLTPDNQPRIWLDTGTRDVMLDVVEHLHQTLVTRSIAHDYAVDPGGHDKTFWEPRMKDYLAFYARDWLSSGRPGTS
jgi:enterochelin esterase-like enzyme